MCPTGRASKRLSETTNEIASTIHRLLEFSPIDRQYLKNEDNQLSAKLIILDEASMIDLQLFYQLLFAIKNESSIIIVGDVDQLSSVGPGNILSDLIRSKKIPTTKLNHIYRQDETSLIVYNSHLVNKGKFPKLPDIKNKNDLADFYFIEKDEPEDVLKTIIHLINDRIPIDIILIHLMIFKYYLQCKKELLALKT